MATPARSTNNASLQFNPNIRLSQTQTASGGQSSGTGEVSGTGKGSSPSPRKISDIKHKLLQPATTSHFICKFSPPIAVNTWQRQRQSSSLVGAVYDLINTDLIEISCSEASLPGSTLMTHDSSNDYHGVSQKIAYRRLYDDRADFTFYVDTRYTIIKYFEGWMTYIVNEQSSKGYTERDFFYRVNYPQTYKTDNLIITKFEKNTGRSDSTSSLEYVFLEAFPISINSMPVTYESSQLLKCTVSFSFSRYYARTGSAIRERKSPDPKNPGNPEFNASSSELDSKYSANAPFSNAFNIQNLNLGRFGSFDQGVSFSPTQQT